MAAVPSPGRVLLITGPAGSGKTTLASRLAAERAWEPVAEDDHWVRQGWGAGLRTAEQERVVQAGVVDELASLSAAGRHAVLDLVVYQEPPNPLSAYRARLGERSIPVATLALTPTVDEIISRMRARGRPGDLADLDARRWDAEWQLHCVRASAVDPAWVIDPTGLTPDETLARALALVGG